MPSQYEYLYFRMLEGLFYTEVVHTSNYTLGWNQNSSDQYSNLAGQVRFASEEVDSGLNEITQFFSVRNRPTTIYVTPFTRPAQLQERLQKSGFNVLYRDAWMFYRDRYERHTLARGVTIRTVDSHETMRIFVETFNQAYSGSDAKEPYGQAPPEWGETLYSSFGEILQGRMVEYYLLYDQAEPASVLITSTIESVGGIYSVGTVSKMRNRGHSGTLTNYAVGQLLERGANEILLQTEKDSYNERFYSKLGFSTEWIAEAWSDKDTNAH